MLATFWLTSGVFEGHPNDYSFIRRLGGCFCSEKLIFTVGNLICVDQVCAGSWGLHSFVWGSEVPIALHFLAQNLWLPGQTIHHKAGYSFPLVIQRLPGQTVNFRFLKTLHRDMMIKARFPASLAWGFSRSSSLWPSIFLWTECIWSQDITRLGNWTN